MANTYQGACGRVPSVRPGANFKEAVCIDTNRVYDSVSDKNCQIGRASCRERV